MVDQETYPDCGEYLEDCFCDEAEEYDTEYEGEATEDNE